MGGLPRPGTGRTYDDFRGGVGAELLPLLDSIRGFCLGLGENVVEDVRMHRVVFCKSIAFRWFADVAPGDGGITVKIQRGRREPPAVVRVRSPGEFEAVKPALRGALESLR